MTYGKQKRRPKKLHVRIHPAEHASWKRAAAISGQTLSNWIRNMLNDLSGCSLTESK